MTEAPAAGSQPTRSLGPGGLVVGMQGLGCMGMSMAYGQPDDGESVATLRHAVEVGVTLFDTADVYGAGHNERLVGQALGSRRDDVVIATKFAFQHDGGRVRVNGRPEYVRACCDASLVRLGSDRIDLYYQHRVDPRVPIEETVGAMADLVAAGKVRHLGLSEASARSLERAAAVHPITALQSEWSLWTRDLEAEVLEAARRLGVGIVPYSPLGRGFLTGTIDGTAGFDRGDIRGDHPRFLGGNLARNLELVDALRAMATERGCTAGQLALAWVLAQGPDVVPIPGTKRRRYLDENLAANHVELSADDLARIDAIAPPRAAAGDRYAHGNPAYGDSPER